MQLASPMSLAAACMVVAIEAGAFSYEPYRGVLEAHVDSDGYVDYAGLVRQREGLDDFVVQLAELESPTYQAWANTEKLAFWVNAYNALTLKAVADHYPVKSIKDIGNVFVSVWDKLKFTVMGKPMTLNHIEHEILRKQFADPRIHMAINCASIGCPPLANAPLRAETMQEQFEGLTRAFLCNPSKFRIDRAGGVVHLSPIFKWFGDDFIKIYGAKPRQAGISAREGAVLNFIAGHLDPEDAAHLRTGRFKIKYMDYDWDLNRQ